MGVSDTADPRVARILRTQPVFLFIRAVRTGGASRTDLADSGGHEEPST